MSVPVPLADAGSLVAAAREGDSAAFEELLAPVLVPAHKLAFTMLAQREAAEDAVQEAASQGVEGRAPRFARSAGTSAPGS